MHSRCCFHVGTELYFGYSTLQYWILVVAFLGGCLAGVLWVVSRLQEYEGEYLERMKQLYGDTPLVSMESDDNQRPRSHRAFKKKQRKKALGFQYAAS